MIINDFFTNPKRSARNVAENSQRVDSLVTDALRVMKGPEISDAVLALKRVLGDREYNSRRGFYSFYVDQIHRNWQLPMYGQQNLAEDADELPPGSLGSMPTTDYVKNLYSTAAERGMAAPDPAAVKNSMALNPKGDVDVSGTFNKGIKAFQNPELTKNLNALTKLVGRAETDYINHPVATGTGNETPQMHTTPLTQRPNYLDSRPATGTGKETPRLDTRPATARPNANYDNMMQPMEQEGNVPTGRRFQSAPPIDNVTDTDNSEQESDAATTAVDTVTPVQSTAKLADLNRPPEDWIRLLGSDPFAASRAAAAGPSNAWPAGMTNSEYTKLAGLGATNSATARKPDGNRRINANGFMAADDHEQYMKDLVAAEKAAKQKANSVPAINAVSSTDKTEPVRMSMTMGSGAGDSGEITSGSKGRIDQATIDRARAWAAKQNAPAAAPKSISAANSATASKTTAPSWQDIARANKLANPNLIYPGQLIKLPNGTFAEVDKGDTLSSIANRYRQGGYIKETDVGDTMDDGFKWGSATMPMQDGSVHKYNPQTNSYSQATPPTRPDLNTNISTITRDRTTDKNGQANQNYSDVSIATNPATGTGDYMHRQDVNGTPTTTFRQNVPAAELAKLRSQHFNEDINRMQNLAGIRKK